MRTIIWVSPLGITRTVTVGGRRSRPLPSALTVSLDSFETFLESQRERVARDLQQTLWRVQSSRNDGMTPSDIRSDTTIIRRA